MQSGAGRAVREPDHAFVGYFIGRPGMNIVPDEVKGRQARIDGHTIALDRSYDALHAGAKIEIGIRPEFVASTTPAPGLLSANIGGSTISAASASRSVRVGDAKFAARVPPGFATQRNNAGLRFDAVACACLRRQPAGRGDGVMNKPVNQKAWLLVVPVFICVAFSAILPLMTVVNYSVQDIIGPTQHVFVGTEWFRNIINDDDLRGALGRADRSSRPCVLLFEIPLGVGLALAMPRRAGGVGGARGARDAAADSVECRRHDLADLRAARYRPARLLRSISVGIDYNYTRARPTPGSRCS